MTSAERSEWALAELRRDLEAVFGDRLRALAAYGAYARRRGAATPTPAGPHPDAPTPPPALTSEAGIHTVALVETLRHEDLRAAAGRAPHWRKQGLAMPLVLTRDELRRSLDAFPLEYSDILDHHVVLAGEDPFDGLEVKADDLRRGVEAQAKGHLIHLREGFLETGGRAADVARLVAASAPSFVTILRLAAKLDGAPAETTPALGEYAARIGIPASFADRIARVAEPRDIPKDTVETFFPEYLSAAGRLWRYLDEWRDGD